MEKKFDINEEGYSIRCKLFVRDSDKTTRTFEDVAIITHGFGSHKDTAGTANFGEHLVAKYKGYAAIAFDWPCHGEDARKKLSVTECLTYLRLVTAYARQELQAKHVYNYSTSFGAYLTLRYIREQENPFTKIALRSPAVTMLDSMRNHISEADRSKLAKGKEIQVGFERKMKLDQSFLDDLAAFDVMEQEYFDFADAMRIIHGTKDEMIPFAKSQEFAENNVIEFVPVEGANHPFQNQNHMALAISQIVDFFKCDKEE